jgi:ribosomal-protein-alanine N-acetyltransferase
MNKQQGYHFRSMRLDDIDEVCQIEKQSFQKPWSREAFQNELTQNHFAQYAVVVLDGKVVGYCGMWLIVDEAHITNIALLPDFRGKGIGENLLKEMMRIAQWFGTKKMTLEVRVSNEAAQRLYEKLGFEKSGIRPKYYMDNMEDAIIMWVDLNE